MSHTDLPAYVDPYKLSEQGASIEGRIPVSRLERVEPLVMQAQERVQVRIDFMRDAENRRVARGYLELAVQMVCQRCMEPVDLVVSSEFELAFVVSEEQARNLPHELEPVILEDREFDVWRAVEDEILLSMPAFPVHEDVACIERLGADLEIEPSYREESNSAGDNPFRVLEALKSRGRQELDEDGDGMPDGDERS